MNKPVILLDCDQCVLDFNQRVSDIFEELFGYKPQIKEHKAFKATNFFDFSVLTPKELEVFNLHTKGANMWRKMKPMEGAKNMIDQLSQDHDIVIFTSMNPAYKSIREENLRELGMKITKVVPVAGSREYNPKEAYAKEVDAKFFIDDLLKNFVGLQSLSTQLVFLDHGYTDGANSQQERDTIIVSHSVTSTDAVVKLIC